MYDTAAEAERRLLNTIVTFDGRPVKVVGAGNEDDGINILYVEWPFRSDEVKRANQADKRWRRFETPPLGFANYYNVRHAGPHATLVERLPVRRTKQGLSSENFTASTIVSSFRHEFPDFVRSDAFVEMVMDVYPTFEEAAGALVPNSSAAISRDYALVKQAGGYLTLFERREEIGLIVRDRLFLRSDRHYLTEALIEDERIPLTIDTQ